jgi:hypothetical protein
MRRERIDAAIHAQIDRMVSLLRDVDRSGGSDRWSHLFSHGHKFPTVRSAVRQEYLSADGYRYRLTDSGRQYLADLDAEQIRRQIA